MDIIEEPIGRLQDLFMEVKTKALGSREKNNQAPGDFYPPVPLPWRPVSRKMKHQDAVFCPTVARSPIGILDRKDTQRRRRH